MGSRVRMLALASAVLAGVALAAEAGVRLSKDEQNVFCGVEGYEAGPKYGQAVNAEVTWRMSTWQAAWFSLRTTGRRYALVRSTSRACLRTA